MSYLDQPTSNIDHASLPNHPVDSARQSSNQASPTATAIPLVAYSAPPQRHHCPHYGCNTSTARRSDLSRHMLTHQTGPKAFDCPFPTCNRKGFNGFARSDKMQEHFRTIHQ